MAGEHVTLPCVQARGNISFPNKRAFTFSLGKFRTRMGEFREDSTGASPSATPELPTTWLRTWHRCCFLQEAGPREGKETVLTSLTLSHVLCSPLPTEASPGS